MSRIGKRELVIPTGVTVTVENNTVTVKGPKGELSLTKADIITVKEVEGKIITFDDTFVVNFNKELSFQTSSDKAVRFSLKILNAFCLLSAS